MDASPFPVRVAAVLAAIVGVVTIVGAVFEAAPWPIARNSAGTLATARVVAGIGVCIAAILVFRRRRLGAWLVLAACVLPSIVGFFATGQLQPPRVLLVLAALTLLVHWPLLR